MRALLVGINAYPEQPLEGCVNDVQDMQAFLQEVGDFDERHIEVLLDDAATRRAIIAALHRLLRDAGDDDDVVFHFAGHGAQIPSEREADGLSETLCPVDFDWTQSTALFDDEIGTVFASYRDASQATCIFDCCYSGGIDRRLRGRGVRARRMVPPPEVAGAMARYRRAPVRSLRASLAGSAITMMACAEHEVAADAIFDGRPNGAFTYHLLQQLGRDPARDVTLLIGSVAGPLRTYDQTPQVRGPSPRLHERFLQLRDTPPAPTEPTQGAPWWREPAGAASGLPQTRPVPVTSEEFRAWHRATDDAARMHPQPVLPAAIRRAPPKVLADRKRGAETDRLGVNESLSPGQRLVSADRHCRLEFQGDGNLVLYADDAGRTFVRWASNTSGQPGASVVMQEDGNLVLYSDQGAALWSSGTWMHAGAQLFLQDDENLVIYQESTAVWSTNTWTARTPLTHVHCYANSRPDVDWNTCGSAAIATLLDFWNTNPFDIWKAPPKDSDDGKYHWRDGEAIDAVIGAGLGPDVVFGWGTTGGRIAEALNRYGLPAAVGYAGVFLSGWQDLWRRLQEHLAGGFPVPVMIDLGVFGAGAFAIHWAIAYRIDHGRVYLGNCPWNPSPTIDEFLRAWQCSYLPLGFNYCAVYHQRGAQPYDRRAFDAGLYLRIHDDLTAAFGGDQARARDHWVTHGIGEGRRGSFVLDPVDYLARHGDLVNAFGASNYAAAIDHFASYGTYEGRRSSFEFDAKWYLANHGDLVAAFGADNYPMALEHFLHWGLGEGRRSSAEFDVEYYLNSNGDLVNAFGASNYPAALEHWLHYGKGEGRRPAP